MILEVSARWVHTLTNGHVVQTALSVGNDLVVDSDAHDPQELVLYELARRIARGARVPEERLGRVLSETARRLLGHAGKA